VPRALDDGQRSAYSLPLRGSSPHGFDLGRRVKDLPSVEKESEMSTTEEPGTTPERPMPEEPMPPEPGTMPEQEPETAPEAPTMPEDPDADPSERPSRT
jgi:hypothetical protein